MIKKREPYDSLLICFTEYFNHKGDYSAVALTVVSVVTVASNPPVVVSEGTTSSVVGVVSVVTVVVVSTVAVVSSVAVLLQPAKRATPATRATRVNNFFIRIHLLYKKDMYTRYIKKSTTIASGLFLRNLESWRPKSRGLISLIIFPPDIKYSRSL